MGTTYDLTGMKFGRLTVLSIGSTVGSKRHWLCLCECGNHAHVRTQHLVCGKTASCGCLTKPMSDNGLGSGSPTHTTWKAMITRCTNKNHSSYHHYGAKGITVCDEWKRFSCFVADMGKRPDGTSLDRIDGAKGYYRDNCRWATPKQQSQNTKVTKLSAEKVGLIKSDTRFYKDIARAFNISIAHVSRVKCDKTGW